jgi:predicted amidophosphoribosyltransferase
MTFHTPENFVCQYCKAPLWAEHYCSVCRRELHYDHQGNHTYMERPKVKNDPPPDKTP